jgi:hypothetical protein
LVERFAYNENVGGSNPSLLLTPLNPKMNSSGALKSLKQKILNLRESILNFLKLKETGRIGSNPKL